MIQDAQEPNSNELKQFSENFSLYLRAQQRRESHKPGDVDDMADCDMQMYAKQCSYWYEKLNPKEKLLADALKSAHDNTVVFVNEDKCKHYFGCCPVCLETDGFINIGPDHYFICREHKKYWFIGSNLFDCWRDQEDKEEENRKLLEGFEGVANDDTHGCKCPGGWGDFHRENKRRMSALQLQYKKADICKIIGEFVPLSKCGQQSFIGDCPFCYAKESFIVGLGGRGYHCLSCASAGDVFIFMRKIQEAMGWQGAEMDVEEIPF